MPNPEPTITIRGLDRETYDAFRRGAAARGITQAEYLRRLIALHRLCRENAHPEFSARTYVAQAGLEEIRS